MTEPDETTTGRDALIPTDADHWPVQVSRAIRRSALHVAPIHLALWSAWFLEPLAPSSISVSTPAGAALLASALLLLACAVPVGVVIVDADGRPRSTGATLRAALRRAPSLVGWALGWGVIGVAAYFGLVLSVFGVALEEFPVAEVVLWLAFGAIALGYLVTAFGPVFVVGLLSGAGARRSSSLTHRYFGRVLVGSVLVPALLVVVAAVEIVWGVLDLLPDGVDDVVGVVASAAWTVLSGSLVAASTAVTWADVRHRDDPDLDAARLAAEIRG